MSINAPRDASGMNESVSLQEARQALERIGNADIVVGVPSYNNGRTIGHVVAAAQAGLEKYFPQYKAVIVNSDGGSKDGTREAVLSAGLNKEQLLLLTTPLFPVHRLSFPYHGIPGKGSAFRLIFEIARHLGARACAVVDSDLRSITPEWIDLLVRPLLHAGFDFVGPYYHRHKYDGTITNSIVYPLTRALYGRRVRQPIGGDFGISQRLVERYLSRNDWETDTARFGIDIWMTTVAIAERYRVCQSFLGAKLHDAKDPGLHLSDMLHQVVGSVFRLMQEYETVWMSSTDSQEVDLFGFRYGVGLDPIEVNTERMIAAFRRGCEELGEIWSAALSPETLAAVRKIGSRGSGAAQFEMDDDLWSQVVLDFAVAYKKQPVERGHLLRSLTPLYLARVASFVQQTRLLGSDDVENKIERLCLSFEQKKPDLIKRWRNKRDSATPEPAGVEGIADPKLSMEV
jgi:glycosyltransferase involved in cell wall biosynthesis